MLTLFSLNKVEQLLADNADHRPLHHLGKLQQAQTRASTATGKRSGTAVPRPALLLLMATHADLTGYALLHI
jgi:hypothetical protein